MTITELLWCRKCGGPTEHARLDLGRPRELKNGKIKNLWLYVEETCNQCKTTLRCVHGRYVTNQEGMTWR